MLKRRPETVSRVRKAWMSYCRKQMPWRELSPEAEVSFWKSVLVEVSNGNRIARQHLATLANLSGRDSIGRQTWVADVSSWIMGKTYKPRDTAIRLALRLLPEIEGR